MEGGLSVIMVMEDCQCSYTVLFDQVPGVIRNSRVISPGLFQNLSFTIFSFIAKLYGTKMQLFFFISHLDRHEVERHLSGPSLHFN